MANTITVDRSTTVISTTVSPVPLNVDLEENTIDAALPSPVYEIGIGAPTIAVSSLPAPTLSVEVFQPQVAINLEGIGGTIQGPPGPPGILQAVWGERPGGTIDGNNLAYTTANPYTAGLLGVYLNGLRLRPSADYTETGNQSFQLIDAPLPGDSLSIDYIKPS